jgi:peptide/nickel transport system ATP-binding protein
VADLADRVVVMYAGRTIEEGTTDAIFARPSHPYTRGLLDAVPNPERRSVGLKEIPGRVPTMRHSPAQCTFADRCGFADDLCRRELPLLGPGPAGHPVRCFHPLEQPS